MLKNAHTIVWDNQYPFIIEKHYSEEDVYMIDIPKGFKLESNAGKLESIDSPFGLYELKLEVKDQQVVCTRKLEIRPIQVPAERFEEVRDFYNQVVKSDKLKMVLIKEKT